MNLAERIEQGNEVLRDIAQKVERPKTPEPIRPRREWRDPERVRASMFMLAIPGIGEILRENFKAVPAEYFEELEDGARTVSCLCSAQSTVAYGSLHRCHCHRIFWNGVTLKCAPAPEPEDVVICDGPCGDDLKLNEGRWVRLDGHELYVCQHCAAHCPGEVL